jgi:Tfp pilus assembly protein PilO
VTLSERDRRLLAIIIVVAVLGGFWFVLLNPKRKDASEIKAQITQAQAERDTAVQAVQAARQARTSFAADYATVIRLGKAVPETVDMPSLLVQLETAARGTSIDFLSITVGPRAAASAPPTPVIPKDNQAASAPGAQRDAAQGGVDQANQANQGSATQQTGVDAGTSTTPSGGGLPVGGGSTATEPAGQQPSAVAPGLDAVPLDFAFSGSYFDLADFLHRLKRFVRLTGPDGNRILVRGRLMVIDSITYATSQDAFPKLAATVKATVYLAPKAQGTTAGATPTGPATGTQPAAAAPGVPGAGGTVPAGDVGSTP